MDHLTEEKRSWNMSRIHSSNTKAEVIVRSYLHNKGFRFRLKNKIPGKPDIYLKKYGSVIFVHGCFWHRHTGCRRASTPKSNKDYWDDKFRKNTERDKRVIRELKKKGLKVHIIWECQVHDQSILEKVVNKIRKVIEEEKHE
jgi:DNA mismatch endonuclease, patch repair protein